MAMLPVRGTRGGRYCGMWAHTVRATDLRPILNRMRQHETWSFLVRFPIQMVLVLLLIWSTAAELHDMPAPEPPLHVHVAKRPLSAPLLTVGVDRKQEPMPLPLLSSHKISTVQPILHALAASSAADILNVIRGEGAPLAAAPPAATNDDGWLAQLPAVSLVGRNPNTRTVAAADSSPAPLGLLSEVLRRDMLPRAPYLAATKFSRALLAWSRPPHASGERQLDRQF